MAKWEKVVDDSGIVSFYKCSHCKTSNCFMTKHCPECGAKMVLPITIKCGKYWFEVTGKDRILDNGACYQLITQYYFDGFDRRVPLVAKTTFNELLKTGQIEMTSEKYKRYDEFKLYKFVEQKPESDAKPHGEWGKWIVSEIRCPKCLEYYDPDCYSKEELNKCPNCGADMRKGGVI